MREPRDLVAEIEKDPSVPEGTGERFFGYSVIGLPFESGHVLALRRFAASSIGPAYASVWHRDPDGNWTFYQNILAQQACSRYFGKLLKESVLQDITIEWTGPRSFTVLMDADHELRWELTLKPTVGTVFLSALAGSMPASWLQNPAVLSAIGEVARLVLRTGKLRLIGATPNGQTFVVNPRKIWLVSESRAVVRGEDIGSPGPLAVQAQLGDFLIPQRGLFAIGSALLENFDVDRHFVAIMQAETP
jgi:hypothetical protein